MLLRAAIKKNHIVTLKLLLQNSRVARRLLVPDLGYYTNPYRDDQIQETHKLIFPYLLCTDRLTINECAPSPVQLMINSYMQKYCNVQKRVISRVSFTHLVANIMEDNTYWNEESLSKIFSTEPSSSLNEFRSLMSPLLTKLLCVFKFAESTKNLITKPLRLQIISLAIELPPHLYFWYNINYGPQKEIEKRINNAISEKDPELRLGD